MNQEKIKLAKEVISEINTLANSIAKKEGYGTATEIIIGEKNEVVKRTEFGYRKNTTGEYIPNSYRNNFGWKNTYYQNAETIVSLEPRFFNKMMTWKKFLKENQDIEYNEQNKSWQEN